MAPTLIVLALLALGVAIVVWATRGKRTSTPNIGRGESDTAWNDPVTPAQPGHPVHHRDDAAPPPAEPRH